MSVWDHLGDPEQMARLLQHPAHAPVTAAITDLITELRATSGRDALQVVQEKLAAALHQAETQFRAQSRLSKLGKGDPVDLMFWRRTCVQLRAVGDAVAWRFLDYRRQWILLMGHNQRPGLMSDKKGFDTEWQLFNEHWDNGEPTLLTALTNCITLGDLLVAKDDVLWTIEAKQNPARSRSDQMGRLRALQRQLNDEPRVAGAGGPSWVLESEVPLVSFWSSAEPHLARAVEEGVAAWVPTEGVGVLYMSWMAGTSVDREGATASFERERQAAQGLMGSGQHRILMHSYEYPYRQSRAAPYSILPLAPELAAMLLTGGALFTVEVQVERLMDALRDAGLEPRNLLSGQPDGGALPNNLIAWRSATSRGTVHRGAMEQLALDLTDPVVWARALATTRPPRSASGRLGIYVCLAGESGVWA